MAEFWINVLTQSTQKHFSLYLVAFYSTPLGYGYKPQRGNTKYSPNDLGVAAMKLTSFVSSAIVTVALAGTMAIGNAPFSAMNPQSGQVVAKEVMAKELSSQEKITQIAAIKGKPGSADLMRQYYKDLTPIGIQPGGAGMVVNLYSKKENTTLSLCTVYDVVVAVKKGEIAKFAAAEVK
jgi:hypothetical protein